MARVYLVGAGPGAADLITLRGARVLEQAEIIFYDALVGEEILSLAPRAKKIRVGKRCGTVSIDQRFINRCLVEAAQNYRIVVRLKGGDPMLFGRAHEEIKALRAAGVSYEIVPGVTTASAAASQLGVSLTRRGLSRNLTFATPRVGAGEDASDYMAAHQIMEVAKTLVERGMPAHRPVVILENVSMPNTRKLHTTLGKLEHGLALEILGPAVVLIGEVFSEAYANAGDVEDILSQLKTSAGV
jgi:uroporphyrin-III C-methyltransferase